MAEAPASSELTGTITGSFETFLVKPSVELAEHLIQKNLRRLAVDKPMAAEVARNHATDMIQGLSSTADTAIKRLMARAIREDMDKAELQERLAQIVGLTQRQALQVENYRDGLIKNGVPRGQAREQSNRLARDLRKQRAKVIARTEMQKALNTARREQWRARFREAGDQGYARQWVTAKDERMCAICKPLNGMLVPVLHGSYVSTVAGSIVEGPPIHPNCRCYEKLVKTDKNLY